jgi:hypothetical protein
MRTRRRVRKFMAMTPTGCVEGRPCSRSALGSVVWTSSVVGGAARRKPAGPNSGEIQSRPDRSRAVMAAIGASERNAPCPRVIVRGRPLPPAGRPPPGPRLVVGRPTRRCESPRACYEPFAQPRPVGTSAKPGSPASTTELNRYRVSRLSSISWIAPSGSPLTSKFSPMRAGLTDEVSTAEPRWMPHAKSTCAGVFPTRRAIETMSGSSSNRCCGACPSAAQANRTIPCSLHNSWSSHYG